MDARTRGINENTVYNLLSSLGNVGDFGIVQI